MIKATQVSVIGAALLLAGCGGDSIQSPDFTPVLVAVQSVSSSQTPEVGVGESLSFVATGCFTTPPGSNPEVRDAGDCVGLPVNSPALRVIEAEWSSSNTAVATIVRSSGLATGVSRGSVTITAARSGLSASTTLTVLPPTLQDIVIQSVPANRTLPLSQTGSVEARGVYSDSPTPRRLEDGSVVAWRSLDPAIATVMPADANPADVRANDTTAGTVIIEASVLPPNAPAGTQPFVEQVSFTVTGAVLTDLTSVVCTPDRVQPGLMVSCQALGSFSDGSTNVPLDNSLLNWTSSLPAIAAVVEPIDPDANNIMVSAVAEGVSEIRAVRIDQPAGSPEDAASTLLTVTDPVCVTPLRTPDASAAQAVAAGCAPVLGLIGCSVSNEAAVVDASEGSFATVSVQLSLVGGSASITATSAGTTFPGGDRTGFIIGRPTGTIEPAEIVEQLQVQTLLNGVVQETSTATNIRADFLGNRMVDGGMDDQFLLSFPTTGLSETTTALPFNGVRFIFNSAPATSLVDTRVYDTCGVAVPPVAPPPPAP